MIPFDPFCPIGIGTPEGLQQAHCPDCHVPLDGTQHQGGCPYQQALAAAMQNVTAERLTRVGCLMNAARWREMRPAPEVQWHVSPRPGIWGWFLRLVGHEAGWVTRQWPEKVEAGE